MFLSHLQALHHRQMYGTGVVTFVQDFASVCSPH